MSDAGRGGPLARLLGGKLGTDIAWTMGSVAILASSGIIINLTIAGLRDAAALGVFNLAYAVYIVAAQISAFGLHYSVLRHAALHDDDPQIRGRMLVSAALCAFGLGIAGGSAVYFGAPYLGLLFNSPSAGQAIAYAGIGLILFPLNKVLIAYLNGLRHMPAFAVLQSLRYILVMLWVGLICLSDRAFELSALAFFIAECLTVLGAVGYILWRRLGTGWRFDAGWLRTHLTFGAKSLFAGILIEINSRIDVLLIGVFLADREVGIYSFAAMVFDGLYHVLAMIRVNFTPVLVGAIRDRDWQGATGLLSKSRRYVYPGTIVLSLGSIAAFWVIAEMIIPDKGLVEGMTALIILLAGLTLISAMIPFEQLLVASGFPGRQSLQYLSIVLSNVALNLALVPILGINGAAVATACALIVGMAVLTMFSRRLLSWNLLTNRLVA